MEEEMHPKSPQALDPDHMREVARDVAVTVIGLFFKKRATLDRGHLTPQHAPKIFKASKVLMEAIRDKVTRGEFEHISDRRADAAIKLSLDPIDHSIIVIIHKNVAVDKDDQDVSAIRLTRD